MSTCTNNLKNSNVKKNTKALRLLNNAKFTIVVKLPNLLNSFLRKLIGLANLDGVYQAPF